MVPWCLVLACWRRLKRPVAVHRRTRPGRKRSPSTCLQIHRKSTRWQVVCWWWLFLRASCIATSLQLRAGMLLPRVAAAAAAPRPRCFAASAAQFLRSRGLLCARAFALPQGCAAGPGRERVYNEKAQKGDGRTADRPRLPIRCAASTPRFHGGKRRG